MDHQNKREGTGHFPFHPHLPLQWALGQESASEESLGLALQWALGRESVSEESSGLA